MAKKTFEAQLEALEQLSQQPEEDWTAPLRTALGLRFNYVVAKAAGLAARRHLTQLTPEILAAYNRFFEDPVKTDPQCWAKIALGRALATFELQDADPFLRGLRHIQLEPTWGGRTDTAGPLRSTCALALVQCRELREPDLLRLLISTLADADKSVRIDAARALEQMGSDTASLLLRLRAQVGKEEAEVLGACYAGVLRLDGSSALTWAAKFLAEEDDAGGEAALAIAATHTAEAFVILRDRWQKAESPWFSSVLLSAIALTRQTEAMDFLLSIVEKEHLRADQAVEALLRSLPSEEAVQKLKTLVRGNARLERAFAENQDSTEPQ